MVNLSLLVHDADPPSSLFLPPPLHQVVGVDGWVGALQKSRRTAGSGLGKSLV